MRLLLFGILLALFGCNSESHFLKQAAKHPEWLKTTDTIITHVDTTKTYKDTTIKIKGSLIVDTASIPMAPLDTTNYVIKVSTQKKNIPPKRTVTHSGNSTNILTVLPNGKIIDSCKCDSEKAVIKQLQEVITKTTKEKKTIVIPPSKPNFFQRIWAHYVNFCVVLVSIFLLLIILYILGRSLKFIPKIPWFPF